MMTPNWEFLLGETVLAEVLPKEYSQFALPIRDGLTLFLGGLPQARQTAILAAQTLLPSTATTAERLGLLARTSPVLQKLGQILARDQRLSVEFREQLQQLESLPPTTPLADIQHVLDEELGPLSNRGIQLMPPALAEASVAVVIPFQLTQNGPSGGNETGARAGGVFKVLKRGIQQQLQHELGLLEKIGEHLDQRCDDLKIPHLDYEDAFRQVKNRLLDEVQLENEQRHLQEAQDCFADEPRVQIPKLMEHCTSRVTSMERIDGCKVTAHLLSSASKKRKLGALIAKSLIAKPIFSQSSQSLFHSDPHAGNLFLTTDDRLAILDWSLVGHLGNSERVAIVQIVLGALVLDNRRIVSVLEELCDKRLDKPALRAVVDKWLRHVRQGQLPGLSWLIGMLDDATQQARMRVGPDMMLFRKSLHTLQGVITEVGQQSGQLDKVLCMEFLRHFACEWPQRWLRLPNSRDFATRLSNLDLAKTWFSYPKAATRFWHGFTNDMLERFGRQPESTNTVPQTRCHPTKEHTNS